MGEGKPEQNLYLLLPITLMEDGYALPVPASHMGMVLAGGWVKEKRGDPNMGIFN